MPISRSFEQPEVAEAIVEILGAADGPQTWRVSRTLVLVGTSRACKVRLQGGGVADVHASLIRTSTGFFAIDLLGKGGTLVNGQPVRCARLAEGDEISVGTHRIRVRCSTPRAIGQSSNATELIPRTGRPKSSARVEGDDAVSMVRSMLDEFGQVQLQMADRMQESMMAVLRSFAGFHGEQMDLIREELARIHELTEEQQSLRSQVKRQERPIAGSLSAIPDPSSRLGPSARPPIQNETAFIPTTPRDDDRVENPQIRSPGRSNPVDLHGQIISRIAAIQDERQGRLQKLMKSLLG